MRRTLMVLIGLGVTLALGLPAFTAESTPITFSDGELGEGWQVYGNALISCERGRSDGCSLFLGANATVEFTFASAPQYGRATLWVYDDGKTYTGDPEVRVRGPRWGLRNAWGDVFAITLDWAPYLNGNTYYTHVSTAENSWFNRWNTGLERREGWRKFEFIHTDQNTLKVIMDDVYEAQLEEIDQLRFQWGFTGLYFFGGESGAAGVYIDDIEFHVD